MAFLIFFEQVTKPSDCHVSGSSASMYKSRSSRNSERRSSSASLSVNESEQTGQSQMKRQVSKSCCWRSLYPNVVS